jgi:hypothetical protein
MAETLRQDATPTYASDVAWATSNYAMTAAIEGRRTDEVRVGVRDGGHAGRRRSEVHGDGLVDHGEQVGWHSEVR